MIRNLNKLADANLMLSIAASGMNTCLSRRLVLFTLTPHDPRLANYKDAP